MSEQYVGIPDSQFKQYVYDGLKLCRKAFI